MITLGLVDSVDANGVYVTMPGSRGLLRGPFHTLQNVAAGDRVLVVTTDDGEAVIVGQAAASASGVVDSAMIVNGTIKNEDVAADAAIAVSKLAGHPTSTTDNGIPRWDGTAGSLQTSGVTIDDNNDVTGARNLRLSGASNYIRVDSASGGASAYLDCGASGQWSQIMFRTVVTGTPKNRWAWWKTDASESGSDAGSDLKLTRYNDAGSSLGDALTLLRSSGRVRIGAVGGTAGLEFGSGGPRIMAGTGSPESVVTAPVGSLWLRTNGGAGTTLYVKESGTGNTGWVAK